VKKRLREVKNLPTVTQLWSGAAEIWIQVVDCRVQGHHLPIIQRNTRFTWFEGQKGEKEKGPMVKLEVGTLHCIYGHEPY
jgi:hypothetical protein